MAKTNVRSSYHHGDLRTALIQAAATIIEADGVEGFTLRKAASRAGVSPGAPSHHFDGAKGLLTAVAVQAYRQLGGLLGALPPQATAALDLRQQAIGYVRYAAHHPGLFRLICRIDLIDFSDEPLRRASFDALHAFGQAAARYFGTQAPAPGRRAFCPDIAGALATAHGMAHMVLENRPSLLLTDDNPNAVFIETFLPSVFASAWPERGLP